MEFKLRNPFRNNLVLNLLIVTVIFGVLNTLINTETISRYYSGLFLMVLVMIIMSSSLNIVAGFLGQLHLGHAAFMGIGAYTASLIAMALRGSIGSDLLLFLIATGGAMILTGIAGILIGSPALRLRGDYLAIMTIAFGQIVQAIITNASDLTNGSQGLYGIPKIMTFPIAFWTTVIVVTIIFLFMNSRHGRAILSIREDEIAAESVGINISKYKLLGFVIASMFAAVGGSVFAFSIGFIAPSSFDFMASIEIFVIVVLGGLGSISGSILASIVIVLLPEYLRAFSDYRYLIYSVILIIMMLFRPQGLFGTKELNLRKLVDFKRKDNLTKGSDS